MSDDLLDAVGRGLDEAVLLVGADHRLRHANPAARQLLELPEGSAGLRLDAAVDYRLSLMVTSCLAGGGEVARELVEVGRDRTLLARAVPIVGETDAVGSVALVIRDVTRLRRLETMRTDFVANLSHELRTPIAAIQLLVETLEEGALRDPGVAPEFVHKIGLEVSHMAQMVSELLELSTIEAGRAAAATAAVPIAVLLDAIARLAPLAEERSLTILREVDPDTPAVLGDARALEQVLRNLVHNAIKFTPPGGSIRLVARPIEGGARVELRVVDTGCGIPHDAQRRIFERFYKADKSRQRDGEGTGLGLAIARHTVEAHGGEISVSSAPGHGSSFSVRLPAVADGSSIPPLGPSTVPTTAIDD